LRTGTINNLFICSKSYVINNRLSEKDSRCLYRSERYLIISSLLSREFHFLEICGKYERIELQGESYGAENGLILWCVAWTHLPASAEAEKGRGFYDFGVFAYEDREYDAAEKNFRKALQCAPGNPLFK